jgi:hypothetical protein
LNQSENKTKSGEGERHGHHGCVVHCACEPKVRGGEVPAAWCAI